MTKPDATQKRVSCKAIEGEILDYQVITTDDQVSEIMILTDVSYYTIAPTGTYTNNLKLTRSAPPKTREAWRVTAMRVKHGATLGYVNELHFDEAHAKDAAEELRVDTNNRYSDVKVTKTTVRVAEDDEDKVLTGADETIPF